MPQTQAAPPKSTPKVAMPEGTLAQSDPEIARFIDLEVGCGQRSQEPAAACVHLEAGQLRDVIPQLGEDSRRRDPGRCLHLALDRQR